jgi:hypothetical protein
MDGSSPDCSTLIALVCTLRSAGVTLWTSQDKEQSLTIAAARPARALTCFLLALRGEN